MKPENIDELFRKHQGQFEKQPTSSLWDRLDQKLGEEGVQTDATVAQTATVKPMRRLWLKRLAAAAILIVALPLSWLMIKESNNNLADQSANTGMSKIAPAIATENNEEVLYKTIVNGSTETTEEEHTSTRDGRGGSERNKELDNKNKQQTSRESDRNIIKKAEKKEAAPIINDGIAANKDKANVSSTIEETSKTEYGSKPIELEETEYNGATEVADEIAILEEAAAQEKEGMPINDNNASAKNTKEAIAPPSAKVVVAPPPPPPPTPQAPLPTPTFNIEQSTGTVSGFNPQNYTRYKWAVNPSIHANSMANAVSPPTKMKDIQPTKSKTKRGARKKGLKKSKSAADATAPTADIVEEIAPNLHQLTWLLANWGSTNADASINETWEKAANNTWEATSTAVVNGQFLQHEKISLQQTEDGIFYETTNLYNNTIDRYRLVDLSTNRAVFQNMDNEIFPSTITYSQATDTTLFIEFSGYQSGMFVQPILVMYKN